MVGYGLALPGVEIFGAQIDAHSLLVASLFILLGYQSILFAVLAKTFAITTGLMPEDPRMTRFFRFATLEKGLALGGGALVAGSLLLVCAVEQWRSLKFGPLDYSTTMRWVIPGVTLASLGFQTILSGFFVSILGMGRR